MDYVIKGVSPIDRDFKKIRFHYRGKNQHTIVPMSASVYDSIEREIKRIKDGKLDDQSEQ